MSYQHYRAVPVQLIRLFHQVSELYKVLLSYLRVGRVSENVEIYNSEKAIVEACQPQTAGIAPWLVYLIVFFVLVFNRHLWVNLIVKWLWSHISFRLLVNHRSKFGMNEMLYYEMQIQQLMIRST